MYDIICRGDLDFIRNEEDENQQEEEDSNNDAYILSSNEGVEEGSKSEDKGD